MRVPLGDQAGEIAAKPLGEIGRPASSMRLFFQVLRLDPTTRATLSRNAELAPRGAGAMKSAIAQHHFFSFQLRWHICFGLSPCLR